VAGALWLSELSACKPDEPLDSVYHSAACTIPWSPQKKYVTVLGYDKVSCRMGRRRCAMPPVFVLSLSRTWRLAQLSQLSPCGSEATGSTHSAGHTACPAERKATEAVSMQKLTGIVAWLGNDSQTTSM